MHKTVRALSKDVTAKRDDGVTRKRKRQKRPEQGRPRMRQFGNVDIPQEALIAALTVVCKLANSTGKSGPAASAAMPPAAPASREAPGFRPAAAPC
jgi:hypothetical protein